MPGEDALFSSPNITTKKKERHSTSTEMDMGDGIWGFGMIPLGSQEGPLRRGRDLNMIPDLFHYHHVLLSSSTASLEHQGK